MSEHASVIAVLDADPDLGEGLTANDRAIARRHSAARVRLLPEGEWRPEHDFPEPFPQIGLLVVEGLLTRELTLAGRTTTELLGAGDLLRPWDHDAGLDGVPFEVRWVVQERARLAVLDRRFAALVARWPPLVEALLRRTVHRARWLSFQLAISQVTRVDGRLLMLFWQLADRWGKVGPDGVHLPLRLTHQTLGTLVGARRPSVTTALSGLARARLVERAPYGWLLHGDAADAVDRLLDHTRVLDTLERGNGAVAVSGRSAV
jgi:CRP/FNR family cyclic AMP-dependent transcriptional regulator